ncbi:MAG: glycerol-3-phosphate dehydrogenase/oxidase [Gammaproteobacteria bacterium]
MSATAYDLVVVGGGINGVGVAQAAAASGYSVLLLEKQAIAAGTSSKSSKLIHGGLRYLESYEFSLVAESLRERALLLKLAPELVQLQNFYLPLYQRTRRGPALIRTGLSLYYLLSGLNPDARFATVGRAHWDKLQGLRTEGLRAVFRYTDARTDDAQLTRAVMRSAIDLGADLACPAQFTGAQLTTAGCEITYQENGRAHSVRSQMLINAAGPWVNHVNQLMHPTVKQIPVELVQGTHIEVPGQLGNEFYYVESPRDGRAAFVMPREGRLIVGTTETRYRDHPDQVHALAAEETYLLNVLGYYFPAFRHLRRSDLLDSWAGLRVLPAGEGHAFHRSRETILHPDQPDRPRLISIYGGKLTSYRATAAKLMEQIKAWLPDRQTRGDTRQLPLHPD